MQRVGVERDVRHSAPENIVRDLVETLEVPLEHQLPATGDQYGMNIGTQCNEPVSCLAQRRSVNELVVINGDNRPAIFPHTWNTAALGRLRVRWHAGEGRKRSATKK